MTEIKTAPIRPVVGGLRHVFAGFHPLPLAAKADFEFQCEVIRVVIRIFKAVQGRDSSSLELRVSSAARGSVLASLLSCLALLAPCR